MSAAANPCPRRPRSPLSPRCARGKAVSVFLSVPLINLGRGACGARPATPPGPRRPPGHLPSSARPAAGWPALPGLPRAVLILWVGHGLGHQGTLPTPPALHQSRPRHEPQLAPIRSAGVQFLARPGTPASASHGAAPHTPILPPVESPTSHHQGVSGTAPAVSPAGPENPLCGFYTSWRIEGDRVGAGHL